MNTQVPIAIGLGSNRGDRLALLRASAQRLAEDVLDECKTSFVYETEPWGGVASGPFLNAVAVGVSDWKPPAVVHYLKCLERELGRSPSERLGDREIDLDLLAYGEDKWTSEGVTVPHPGLAQRDFVLLPLVDVWPEWKHPDSGKTATELLEGLALSTAAQRLERL